MRASSNQPAEKRRPSRPRERWFSVDEAVYEARPKRGEQLVCLCEDRLAALRVAASLNKAGQCPSCGRRKSPSRDWCSCGWEGGPTALAERVIEALRPLVRACRETAEAGDLTPPLIWDGIKSRLAVSVRRLAPTAIAALAEIDHERWSLDRPESGGDEP